jgi:alkanesulfonate monooxygenase SsuD/methylene tetrahydromethanopterin reductase-like flavin-dependent oxidoreductase (luciferase family)
MVVEELMEIGAHLPLMDFGDHPFTLDHLIRYSETAARLGFVAVAANDHLTFAVPWLDGSTALAAVLAHSGEMSLVTTVALPVVRGPVPLVKSLGAIDRLSGGRLIVGVGPGSSERDYAAVGINFDERWARIDEAVKTMRALWRRDGSSFTGRFYSTDGVALEPGPTSEDGPPVWIGSWGSPAGLRRVARLGDGWLASGYNTTPTLFAEAWAALGDLLIQEGKDPLVFPNALATMWCYITEDAAEAARILEERVAPAVHRPMDLLRDRLAVGPAERFAQQLNAFAAAGVQRVLIWPVADETYQLERFAAEVLPVIDG